MKAGCVSNNSPPIGADDFLPVLVLTLARCSVAGAELEAEVMAGLLPPPLLAGEGGYYLTTLFGAVAVLKKLGAPDNDKSFDVISNFFSIRFVRFLMISFRLQWRTGSLGSGVSCTGGSGSTGAGGVARILVPDETAGALRRVALPWRPGARVRDLCRALAHRARITNPQDYGLFALRDGEGD
jgi:Ras and Rab interactor 2/3